MFISDYGIPTTQPMAGETLETGYNLRLYLRGLISLVHEVCVPLLPNKLTLTLLCRTRMSLRSTGLCWA